MAQPASIPLKHIDAGTTGFTAASNRWLILIGVFLIYLAFLPPAAITPDERSMIAVSLALLKNDTSVPADLGTVGVDGRTYSNWYPLNSVLAVPAAVVGQVLANQTNLSPLYLTAPLAIGITALITALTATLVFRLSLFFGATQRRATAAAFAYAFGTIALVYGRTFFADPLLALVAVASLLATRSRSASTSLLLLSACAVLAKPTGIVVGGVLGVYMWAIRRRASAIAAVVGTIAGLVVYGGYNYVRFGNPLTFGPPWGAFTACCVVQAVTELIVSPGRGLAWYSPVALLGLIVAVRRWRANLLFAGAAGLFVGFLGLHSVWGPWAGGWSWGPRLLLPGLPALVAAAATAPKKGLYVLAVYGAVINVPLLISSYQREIARANERKVTEAERTWSLRSSPMVNIWPSAAEQIEVAAKNDVRVLVKEAGVADATTAQSEAFRIVPLWWWMLPAVGLSRAVGVAVATALAAVGLTCCVRAWRYSSDEGFL